jgi:TATA-box binding protein (TBP) (component of TFIID and TFIIIB)
MATLLLAPARSRFLGTSPPRPDPHFVVYPPDCVFVSNIVTQIRFNRRVCGNDVVKRYPFCRRNSKNWRAVLIRSMRNGAACVYDNGMMMITGCNSVLASRHAADLFIHFLKDAGYPDLRADEFKIINITVTFEFHGALDVEKYEREIDPSIVYIPDSYVGARKTLPRSGPKAKATIFINKGYALGSPDLRALTHDVVRMLSSMRPCIVPFASEEEEELLLRAIQSRKRALT